jgi:hypothetical protein
MKVRNGFVSNSSSSWKNRVATMRSEKEIELMIARLEGRIETPSENGSYEDIVRQDVLLWVLGKDVKI